MSRDRFHLVSYPKSGRSWVRFILVQLGLGNEVRFQHDGFEFNNGDCPPHDFDLEARIARYAQLERIVYLEREPRDVIVSLYHQVTGRFRDFFGYQGDLSAFIRDPYFGAENLRRFRANWDQLVERLDLHRISYEACHQDMHAVMRGVLDYYGFDVDDARLTEAVDAGRFENMREVERSGRFAEPWLRPRNEAPKVRRGRVGGYRDVLSPADIAYLDEIFGSDPG